MKHTYIPHGVCSRRIDIELDDNKVIKRVSFLGGCSGNTQGISALITGMNAQEAIEKIKGIDCGGRGTSCPDQLSIALQEALDEF